MDSYKTVREYGRATQIIEKSRFIAHVMPVETREEADEFLAKVRAEYKDATHNVPAFVIGDKFQIQWGSDDGEPQGTSGAPMVQMLVKEGITNVAVVVTRYFGGIKLGTGGLVRAYTGTAKLGLEAAGICQVRETVRIRLRCDYTYLAKLQNLASDGLPEDEGNPAAFRIAEIDYSDKVELMLVMLPGHREDVISMVGNVTAGTAEVVSEEVRNMKV